MASKISWTDETWNPVVGCTKCSPGCQNCYAERMAFRLACMESTKNCYRSINNFIEKYSSVVYINGGWNNKVFCDNSVLDKPLHWRKPRRIFVCSMGDLFHPKVPFEFVNKVFETIFNTCHDHTYQILTKRPKRMAGFFNQEGWDYTLDKAIHLGVSISNQAEADEKIPILLQLPAAVRFVSLEPLLGEIDLGSGSKAECLRVYKEAETVTQISYLGKLHNDKRIGVPRKGRGWVRHDSTLGKTFIDWVIIGCESINGRAGRFTSLCSLPDKTISNDFNQAAINLVHQCKAAGVPVFVKQVPINGKVSKNMAEWPEELRVQEKPDGKEVTK